MNTTEKLQYYKDLLIELTKKEIKIRYKNSILGYFWSLANPLLLTLIFYFVFKVITKIQMPNYTIFLISGLFVWQWISNSLIAATNIFISNASLIKKVNFPRNFLVAALVLSEGFNFLLSIPVILIFNIVNNNYPTLLWVFIPILFIITALFIYSTALILASTNLFFRDIERLVALFLTFIFYLTPIIYPKYLIPEKYKLLLCINPFAVVVLNWQNIFFYKQFDIKYLFIATLYSFLLFKVSNIIYNKLKYKFAELV